MDNDPKEKDEGNLVFRNATVNDLDFIIQANNIINDNSNLKRMDEKLIKRLKQDFFPVNQTHSNAGIMIADMDKKAIGMAIYSACYYAIEGDCMWLSNIYVDENYRGCGIARKMIEQLKKIARKNGYDSISFLEDVTNEKAKKFAFKNNAKLSDNFRFFHIKLKP